MSDVVLLAGRYRRVERIGQGGMGEVWLAEDELLQRRVAVKRLHVGTGDPDPVSLERIMREARLAARLDTPHAVTIHDVVLEAQHPHLIMQYVAGETLAAQIARGPLEMSVVARVGAEVATALADAHGIGIVHRDVKPANVLIDPRGRALLADFGIARLTTDAKLTQTGAFIGTPSYLAPEVARGEDASAASDVYALGATLYAAVEGRGPYEDGTPNTLALLSRILTQPVPAPTRAGGMADLLLAMLGPDPDRRPGAAEVVPALQAWARFADETQVRPHPPAPMQTTPVPAPTTVRPTADRTVQVVRDGIGAPSYPPPDGQGSVGTEESDPLTTLLAAIADADRVTGGWSGVAEEWQDLILDEIVPNLRHDDQVDLFVPTMFAVDPAGRSGLPRAVARSLAQITAGATVVLADRVLCVWNAGRWSPSHHGFTVHLPAVRRLEPATYVEDDLEYKGFDTQCHGFVWPILFEPEPRLEPLHHLLARRLLGTVRPIWHDGWLVGRATWTAEHGWTQGPGWEADDDTGERMTAQ